MLLTVTRLLAEYSATLLTKLSVREEAFFDAISNVLHTQINVASIFSPTMQHRKEARAKISVLCYGAAMVSPLSSP